MLTTRARDPLGGQELAGGQRGVDTSEPVAIRMQSSPSAST